MHRQLMPVLIRSLAVAITVLLTACATPPAQRAPVDSPPNTDAGWDLKAKVAVTFDAQTQTANLRWQHTPPDKDVAVLAGPMGLGATELQRSGSLVTWLDDGEQKPLATMPLDSSLRAALTSLPIAQLSDWLLGRIPTTRANNRDWEVEVTRWQNIEGRRLPRILRLQHREFQLRLVVLDWRSEA